MLVSLLPETQTIQQWTFVSDVVGCVFNGLFCAVSLCLPLGYTPVELKQHRTEIFIGVCNMVALIGSGMVLMSGDSTTIHIGRYLTQVQCIRLIRIAWLTTGTRRLWTTLKTAAPVLSGVVVILAICTLFYAAAGMALFGRVKWIAGIDEYFNFDGAPSALLILLRSALFDNWQILMWGAAIAPPQCDPDLGDCGHLAASRAFFLTFLFVSQWIAMNSITATLLDTFNETERFERFAVQEADVHHFVRLWKSMSGGSIDMSVVEFIEFLRSLQPPLGPKWGWVVAGPMPSAAAEMDRAARRYRDGGYLLVRSSTLMRSLSFSLTQKLALRVHNGSVYLDDVFFAVLYYYYGTSLPHSVICRLQCEARRVFRSSLKHRLLRLIISEGNTGASDGGGTTVRIAIVVKVLRWLHRVRRRLSKSSDSARTLSLNQRTLRQLERRRLLTRRLLWRHNLMVFLLLLLLLLYS